jgi:PTH1 family peptidyl-tRNA hydrolase
MKALVGLGNPGPEYEGTRHNVGWLALDAAASALGLGVPRKQFRSIIYEVRHQGEKIALMKPQTYMNLSGEAVLAMMQWYKMEPKNIMVFSDDIDLPPGIMRIRMHGGAGTHNGWRSIIQETGSQGFPRARIGIGAPPPEWDLKDWVLSRWDKDPAAQGIHDAITLAAKAGLSFLTNGIQLTMNLYNTNSKPKKEDASAGNGDAG